MGPMSTPLVVLLLVVALGIPIVLASLWFRTMRRASFSRRLATAAGVVLAVLLAQVCLIGAAGVGINRAMGLYPTWADVPGLDGGDPMADIPVNAPPAISTEQAHLIEQQGWAPWRVQPKRGDGQYRLYLVPGPSNHTKQPVIVWIPPGYEKARTLTGLKVVYLYNAAYGNVDWFVNAVRPDISAGPLVRDKKVPAFAIVAPEINIDAPADTECTDYPGGGPQAFTWLAKDVPEWAHTRLGLATGAKNASAIGWSVGGYCAAKVHAARPDVIGAAVSAQGFFAVENDRTTGDLTRELARVPGLRERNDVSWLLAHSTTTPHLLVITAKGDPQSYPQSQAFLERHRARPGVWGAVYEHEGHSVSVWRRLQPDLWRFLVQRTDWPKNLQTL